MRAAAGQTISIILRSTLSEPSLSSAFLQRRVNHRFPLLQ